MLYDSLKEFIRAIRDFKTKHPNSVLKIKDVPEQLKIGFSAYVDGEDGDDFETEWTLPISRFKREAADILTVKEDEAIKKFFSLRSEYSTAEKNYLNVFTGELSKESSLSSMSAPELKDALEILVKYAKNLEDK